MHLVNGLGRKILVGLVIWLLAVALYQTNKPLPEGVDMVGREHLVGESEVVFLTDLTYQGDDQIRRTEQQIFDTILNVIKHAKHYILIDMFLFNSWAGGASGFHRNLSGELTAQLLAQKASLPGLKIDFITDPINDVYGGGRSSELETLKAAGVNVIITNHSPLRDSNFIYSSIWRTFFQWFGNSTHHGVARHPFSTTESDVTLRSYLRLLNFKANHRKVVVADQDGEMITLITSANPHGGSSLHSNIGVIVTGGIWRSVYRAEQAVAALSGKKLSPVTLPPQKTIEGPGRVMVLTEKKIKNAIVSMIEAADATVSFKLAQFYLSDRTVINALIAAAKRGVNIKIILDPNKDAFGYEKNGIPNRPVAAELVSKSNQAIAIRWYDTQGEQYHTKLFIAVDDKTVTAILGSANLTRRNLENYNLELDLKLVVPVKSRLAADILNYFERMWDNEEGSFTLPFEAYQEDSRFKTILYRVQEGLGLSTF